MENNLKKDWEKSVGFWNSSMEITEEDRRQILESTPEDEWKEMAPSKKLFDAVADIAGCGRVLDYGCGHGWGAIIAAKLGCSDVVAVDMAEKAVELTKVYAQAFGADSVKAEAINENWLKEQPAESFDALLCSNVIDVVPLEIAEDIIENAARVLKPGGKAVFGLNFYMSPEQAREKGLTIENDRYLYSDGILRLSLVSDEEWTEKLKKYFTVEKLDHFAWPGESSEGRRLFILSK